MNDSYYTEQDDVDEMTRGPQGCGTAVAVIAAIALTVILKLLI